MRNTRAKNMKTTKGGVKLLVVILIILILVAGGLLAVKFWQDSQNQKQVGNTNTVEEQEEIPEPITFAGNERPIAFMIDNNINAMPQAGLLEADLVYEIIVEGGETRLMLVMQGKDLDKIGPLRSARHYFLDYALENDAIYVHYGQSPQAKEDIESLSISDINGIYESESLFWRDSSRYAPHNAVTSTANIEKIIEREGFRTTTHQDPVLNYVVEQELDSIEEIEQQEQQEKAENQQQSSSVSENNNQEEETQTTSQIQEAWEVTIPYSVYNTVKYEYDPETQTYIRYSRDKKQVDWETEKEVTTKNIIITFIENESIDSYGRQTLYNIKKADGYYITNGKAIPITCEKTSRSGKTIYKDLNGNELKVNDGKTFIQICPINSEVEFKGEMVEE